MREWNFDGEANRDRGRERASGEEQEGVRKRRTKEMGQAERGDDGMQTREETLEGEKEIAGGIFQGRVRRSKKEEQENRGRKGKREQ